MENKAEATETAQAAPSVTVAGIPPRLLAMLIDYLVIAAATLLVGKVSAYSDAAYLITFFVMALYFSSGNSSILEGQTLGKRTFGLRVISCKENKLYLSFREGFYRFLITYGLIILCAETPTILYRNNAIVASPKLLELHMLFVMFLLFANAASVLFRADRRALHDALCGSMVVRGSGDFNFNTEGGSVRRSTLLPAVVGFILALLLWLPSVTHNAPVTAVQRARYLLENRTPLRLVGASSHGESLSIHLVYAGAAVQATGQDDDTPPTAIADAVKTGVKLVRENSPQRLSGIKTVKVEIDAVDSDYTPRRFKLELPMPVN